MFEKKFRAGLIQIPIRLGDRKENQTIVRRWMKEFYRQGELTTAMCLPELWDVGYALNSVRQLADTKAAQAIEFLGGLAKEYGCWFTGGSVMTEEKGKYYNRTLVINPKGELVTHYDKAHLVPFITVEDTVFDMGNKPCVFDMDGIKTGTAICYDIRFPEWIRIYALRGVEVLFLCSQWTRNRMDLFRIMIRARAVENMFYTVAVNNCDLSGTIDFGGESFVCGTDGKIITECSGTYDGSFAEIDVTNIDEDRNFLKVMEKRRPQLYRELIS